MKSIVRPGENAWNEAPVVAAGLLVDGHDYYRAFYDAALKAKRSILLSGWQFDSEARLLCGPDGESCESPTTLLKFLNWLCERTPELNIRVLAWDFNLVFSLEREWMQQIVFEWTTNERLHYRFDSSHVDRGSHHQKFAVIDGHLSFAGGLDLCDQRWDDRRHLDDNPLRVSRGAPHKPFHDVQVYVVSPEVGRQLTELFVCRWKRACDEDIEVQPGPEGTFDESYRPDGAVPIAATRTSMCRTDPHGSPTGDDPVREVLDQYLDAIAAARELIYIETQYFSSREIAEGLVRRVRDPDAPPLQLVLVLNMRAETLKEDVAVGLAQAKNIRDLRAAVEGTKHQLGIYYSVPQKDGGEPERATYIHSKVMVIDDRYLNVGSANLTNRSGSVDTELNLSFETLTPKDSLAKSICSARLNLLAEHLGVEGLDCDPSRLVQTLDERARSRQGRLRLHPSPTENELKWLGRIDPQKLPFDPDSIEDDDDDRSIFMHGLGKLWRRLVSDRDDRK